MYTKYQDIDVIREVDIKSYPKNKITYKWLHIVSNGIGQPIYIPIMIAKGEMDGPVMGVTAVVHGNELNGISVIQRLFSKIDLSKLSGTIVGVPVVNVPSILLNERTFIDGIDLNRIMPGKENGNRSEIYSHRVLSRIVSKFDFLLDLHTASFGRVNSFYVRADLTSKIACEFASLQNPQIILNVIAKDGTLRGAASDLGIDSITIEVGDPDKFQKDMINSCLDGIFNTLSYLKMIESEEDIIKEKAVICDSSYWIYADRGGIMQVFPKVCDIVEKDEHIATVRNIFGQIIKEYYAPEKGIIIGKSTNPVGQTGSRIIHLGIL